MISPRLPGWRYVLNLSGTSDYCLKSTDSIVTPQFAGMVKRHMALKQKYSDRAVVHDVPYKGIENLRPESKKIVEIFLLGLPPK